MGKFVNMAAVTSYENDLLHVSLLPYDMVQGVTIFNINYAVYDY